MVAEDDIVRSLGIGPGQCVAAVGGGGKTSLLTAIAKCFHAQNGKPAILTTTTNIFAPLPEEGLQLALGDVETLSKNLKSYMNECGISWFARRREGKVPVPGQESEQRMKLSGFAPSEIAYLKLGDALTLIEADGARRLPIKAPGPDEPVLPEGLDAVLGVVGLDAVGAPLSEAHVFRPEAFSRICGLGEGEEITAEAVGRVVRASRRSFSQGGGRRAQVDRHQQGRSGNLGGKIKKNGLYYMGVGRKASWSGGRHPLHVLYEQRM